MGGGEEGVGGDRGLHAGEGGAAGRTGIRLDGQDAERRRAAGWARSGGVSCATPHLAKFLSMVIVTIRSRCCAVGFSNWHARFAVLAVS